MKRILAILLLCSTYLQSTAQTETVAMADEMRASGKIYVVVSVLALIFVGLALYLFFIDRKITKLENQK